MKCKSHNLRAPFNFPLPRLTSLNAVFTMFAFALSAQPASSTEDLRTSENIQALVEGGNSVVQVSVGNRHACALVQTGKVFCWGSNRSGQLGIGTNDDVTATLAPVEVKKLENIQQISSGKSHSCALQRGGQVYCWGNNRQGQLGNGSFQHSGIRVLVKTEGIVTQVSAGDEHTCVVQANKIAFCWGSNTSGQLGIVKHGRLFDTPERVAIAVGLAQISSGGGHTCALTTDSEAWCWGENSSGALGTGEFSTPTMPRRVATIHRFSNVSAGFKHTCAVRKDGVPFCWGINSYGQIGDGTLKTRSTVARVKRLFDVEHLSAGRDHTCAVRENGIAVCWGLNIKGAVGDGTTTLRMVRANVRRLREVTNVSAGYRSSCASTEDGSAFCWGANRHGELGNSDANHSANPIRTQVILPVLLSSPF